MSDSSSRHVQELSSEKTELRREVGLFGGLSVLAGIMIGSGIFYIGGIVLARCNLSLGLAILVWVIGGVITLLSGICFAELGAMMPKAGGSYVYLREAFGERIAFINGICKFLLSSPGSIGALAVAFAAAISSIYPLDPLTQKAIAIISVLLLTWINVRGIKFGNMVQCIFMVLKLLPIFLILIAGLMLGRQHPNFFTIPGEMPSFLDILSMIGFAIIATMWAYEGWTNLNNVAEEVKNPKRNIPLSLIISIVGVMVLYVLFNFAIYRVLPFDFITQMVSEKNYYLGTYAAGDLFGSYGKLIVAVAMILAIFNSLNGCIMVFPRAFYAMAKDGLLFKSFAEVHPVYKTPKYAIIGTAIVSIILISFRTLGQLTNLVAIYGLIFHGLTFYAVVVLRKKYPDMVRPYKVWFYPVTIFLVCGITIGLIINTFWKDPVTAMIGVVFPLGSWALYEYLERRKATASVPTMATLPQLSISEE
ncbi:MAG: amino acid permease [Burkholderiales bacterium]|nr:amino acid permease [Burkholderiales bacterium]